MLVLLLVLVLWFRFAKTWSRQLLGIGSIHEFLQPFLVDDGRIAFDPVSFENLLLSETVAHVAVHLVIYLMFLFI